MSTDLTRTFSDSSKAFDVISHGMLLWKLLPCHKRYNKLVVKIISTARKYLTTYQCEGTDSIQMTLPSFLLAPITVQGFYFLHLRHLQRHLRRGHFLPRAHVLGRGHLLRREHVLQQGHLLRQGHLRTEHLLRKGRLL